MEMGGLQPVLLYLFPVICHERRHFECQFSTRDIHGPHIHFVSQDIERDLVNATNHVLPRIVHRLLYTLSYDRKVSYVFFSPAYCILCSVTVVLALTIGKQPSANSTPSEILRRTLLDRSQTYTLFPVRTPTFNLLMAKRLFKRLTHWL